MVASGYGSHRKWTSDDYGFVHKRLNGNGEMTGTHWINEAGYFASPICITNTHSVGMVHHAATGWMIEAYASHFKEDHGWAMPVVAETYDGLTNDICGRHIKEAHVLKALCSAASGFVAEGNVGGGTGIAKDRDEFIEKQVSALSSAVGDEIGDVVVDAGRRPVLRALSGADGLDLVRIFHCATLRFRYGSSSRPARSENRSAPVLRGGVRFGDREQKVSEDGNRAGAGSAYRRSIGRSYTRHGRC